MNNDALHIDIETYNDLDLTEVGVYKYVRHSSFDIILFSYQYDGDKDVTVIDLAAGERIPNQVIRDLQNPNVRKVAHNAAFEIECLRTYLGVKLDRSQWFCTLVASAILGLPLKLEKVAEALRLTQQKDARGKQLIKYFCNPVKSTDKNSGANRNYPEFYIGDIPKTDIKVLKNGTRKEQAHRLTKEEKYRVERYNYWNEFKEYNAQDVRTEVPIYEYVTSFNIPAFEWVLWQLDQIINGRGVHIDTSFVRAAIRTDDEYAERALEELTALTGVENAKSLPQLKKWLYEQDPLFFPSHLERKPNGEIRVFDFDLNKESLKNLLSSDVAMLSPEVKKALELRQATSKTSIRKYEAMLKMVCDDDRARGTLQYYGANRTGRWAGRGIQTHNLPRNTDKYLKTHKQIDTARKAVMLGLCDTLYDNTPIILSQLTRTAITAPKGKLLAVSDFSAIEARVLAWVAGEDWRLDVFRDDRDIYVESIARMLGIDTATVDSSLRARGKVSELALGYQGGVNALIRMGAIVAGIPEEDLDGIVKAWRKKNPHIVRLWRKVEDAAIFAIRNKTSYTLRLKHTAIKFIYLRGYLFIELPNGRRLAYYGAHLAKGKYGEKIVYYGTNQETKVWGRIDTYGGSLVENITQAIARDLLADAMYRMHQRGIYLVLHVHDELIAETLVKDAEKTLNEMNEIMSVPPAWANVLPLKGNGFISEFYKKD